MTRTYSFARVGVGDLSIWDAWVSPRRNNKGLWRHNPKAGSVVIVKLGDILASYAMTREMTAKRWSDVDVATVGSITTSDVLLLKQNTITYTARKIPSKVLYHRSMLRQQKLTSHRIMG
mmetsp:Transcript_2910/g.4420  ORF Transcript_2910/g.4420 Transcript_2910/m.4420 type:complete len:119 (+) Transcript_2910:664-1020(+)